VAAGVAQAREVADAEEVERGEDVFGGAVGVGGVLGDRQLRVQDRLERVDGFALADGGDLGAVLAVLLADPVHHLRVALAASSCSSPRYQSVVQASWR